MFVGRETELNALEELYAKNGYTTMVVYGRRRVGKTALLKEFANGKRCVFFTAVQRNMKANIARFLAAIPAEHRPMTVNPGFEDLLGAVGRMADGGRTVLIIDEFPYLAQTDPSITSRFQAYIGDELEAKDIMIIVCGSSMAAMLNGVLSSKSPLFGRRTSQLKVEPMDYAQSALLLDGFDNDQKFRIYSMVGGIPMYLRMFDSSKSLDENVTELFLRPQGYMRQEPSMLLQMEMRDPAVYSDILSALANGRGRLSEIATYADVESSTASIKLSELMFLGLVDKVTPFGEKPGKKTRYVLGDNLLRFHYAFIDDTDVPYTEEEVQTFLRYIDGGIRTYLGRTFEGVCRRYCRRRRGCLKVGTWWGTGPGSKVTEEIDIVGSEMPDGSGWLLFAECKYRTRPMGTDELETLVRRSSYVDCKERRYALFSASGFEDELRERAEDEGVTLVTLDDLYSGGFRGGPPSESTN
ncbi:MAG: ATP-binding protein [Thermoplasmata archaeon]|nr:ATP-binding protein [Thermoplasmata archaeon]